MTQNSTEPVVKINVFISKNPIRNEELPKNLKFNISLFLLVNQPYQIAIKNQQLVSPVDEEFSVITVDDAVGYEHQYHAFVLYADEDKDFVDELYEKMDGMFQVLITLLFL